MALQNSVAVRNAEADARETATGTAPVIRIYSGSVPANCAAAASGTLLAQGTLPSDWLGAASGGVKALAGTWTLTGQSGAGAGTAAGYFRILDSAGTTCHWQGTVTASGGGGDMTLDNVSIANAQTVNVTTFTYTSGNA